jgi:hypothetical protein
MHPGPRGEHAALRDYTTYARHDDMMSDGVMSEQLQHGQTSLR